MTQRSIDVIHKANVSKNTVMVFARDAVYRRQLEVRRE